MVCGHGINDMPYGWVSKNKWNKRVYQTWSHMLERCYSEKYHKIRPSYIECLVCDDWLLLSNFIHDFKLIDGYDEEKFLNGKLALDKDIKSNGKNKEYNLDNCMLVSIVENTKQANKTRDCSKNNYKTGKDSPCSIKVAQYDKQGNLIKVWDCISDVERELGINQGNISTCCTFWKMDCDKEKWYETHKGYPYKTIGGFIWKYYDENK